MRNKLFFSIAMLFALVSKAQISIIQYPLQGLELKPSDIFRVDIISADNVVNKVYINGSIVNTATGESIVTGRSQVIDLAPGSKSITEAIAVPKYTIASSEVNQTGVLPYGNYRICIQVIKVNGVEELATACQEVEITPLSPPLLLSPENQSSVTESYPLLVWLPPMPISKEKVVYDLKLVEILPNQTPYDALQRNFALLEKQGIQGTTLQYPASSMRLEEGKRYAWKVEAKTLDRKPIGETEVWWFTKTKGETASKEEGLADYYYIILDDNSNKSKVTVKQKLKIVSYDYSNAAELNYRIVDQNGQKIASEEIELVNEGSGKFIFNFINPKKLSGKTYRLEVTSLKGREKYIVFTFLK